MWQVENNFRVRLGGNTYVNVENLVEYDGVPLFSLRRHENGYLGIDFNIFDATGKKVASVKRNEIYPGERQTYELQGDADRYALLNKETGRVICEIKKRSAAVPAELDVTVQLYTPDGFLFAATPEATNLPNVTVKNNVFENVPIGISINPRPPHRHRD